MDVVRFTESLNIKEIQEVSEQTRSDVTLDIYTTVTKELTMKEFWNFEEKLQQQKWEWERTMNEEWEGQYTALSLLLKFYFFFYKMYVQNNVF